MKLINKILFYIKIFLLLIAFAFSLYITFMKMEFTSSNLLTVLPVFIPFLSLLVFYVLDLFLERKEDKISYNLISILLFIAIISITLRSVFDKNIIAYPATINLNYYGIYEGWIKVLLYLLLIGNILLLIKKKANVEKTSKK